MAEQTTRILLVRHATNDFVREHRIAGWLPGVCLNRHGLAQAEALGVRLAKEKIVAIYSSPLERTLETAEAIAKHHGLKPVPVDGIGESRCGEWTGRPVEELRKTDAWQQIQLHPSGARFPGGESLVELQQRMVNALEVLRSQHVGATFVAVSHSDPIKLAVAHYVGLHMDLFQRLVIDPASITEIEFSTARPRLLRCNDSAHLPEEPKVGSAAEEGDHCGPH
jgi:probable phosphomutase (TIGR03848 family)